MADLKQTSLFSFDEPERPAKKPVTKRRAAAAPPPPPPPPPVAVKPVIEKKKSTRGRKSIKELSETVSLVEIPEDEVLFQKMYYPIGEVAGWFKVNASLLRLWENEFDVLKPKKNGKGDRLFRPEDVKNIQLIYHLTREKKYTLEGAKDFFRNNKKAEEKFAAIDALKKMRSFLLELKASL